MSTHDAPADIMRNVDAAQAFGLYPPDISKLIRIGRIRRYVVGGHPFVSRAEVEEVVSMMPRRSARRQNNQSRT